MSTVFQAFIATADAAPDHAFLCAPPAPGRAWDPDGVEYTYAEARTRIAVLRERYSAAGYGHGHRVALLLGNRCLGRLAYFKAPGWVLFVDALPTTGTQKVQKGQIFPRGEDPRRRAGTVDVRARKKRG